jgi:hypothetical protein
MCLQVHNLCQFLPQDRVSAFVEVLSLVSLLYTCKCTINILSHKLYKCSIQMNEQERLKETLRALSATDGEGGDGEEDAAQDTDKDFKLIEEQKEISKMQKVITMYSLWPRLVINCWFITCPCLIRNA